MHEWLYQRAVFDAALWLGLAGLCSYWVIALVDSIFSDVRLARRLKREREELLKEPEMPTLLELREWHMHRAHFDDGHGPKVPQVCSCLKCEAVRLRLGFKPTSEWNFRPKRVL